MRLNSIKPTLHSLVLACGPGDRCHHINDELALVLQNGEGMGEWWCKWNGGVNRMQKRSDMSIASVHFIAISRNSGQKL